MSATLAMKNTEGSNHHKQRLTPNGTLFEFVASPDETGSEICLIPRFPLGLPSHFTATPTLNPSMYLRARSKRFRPETAITDV
jgi:hypothetical protein